MSLGGFTSLVQIARLCVSGGFTDHGQLRIGAEMELEGRLLVFLYGNLRERITRQTKTSVHVEIKFTEIKAASWNIEDENKPYIGTIQLFDHTAEENVDTEIDAIVKITLPMNMVQQLGLMQGRYVKLETIHDLIQSPTEDQKQNHVVALVKRVYFETTSGLEPETEKKRWNFGRR